MTNYLSYGGHAIFFGLHSLFVLAFLLGLLFFVVWALRNLKKEDLKKWAIWLLVIGILGCLLTMTFGARWGFKGYKDGKGLGYDGMWKCMDDDECRGEFDDMMDRRGIK